MLQKINKVFWILSGKGKINDMSLEDIGYKGKPIMDLSPEEATDLVSENGFWNNSNFR